MGRKTTVPNPHLIECFHMKQGGHQDFGSYPFNHGLLEPQHQAGDRSVCRKGISSRSLGGPHTWLSAVKCLEGWWWDPKILDSLFQRVQTRGVMKHPCRHQQFTPHRGLEVCSSLKMPMPALQLPASVWGKTAAWKWEGLSIKQSREFVVMGTA